MQYMVSEKIVQFSHDLLIFFPAKTEPKVCKLLPERLHLINDLCILHDDITNEACERTKVLFPHTKARHLGYTHPKRTCGRESFFTRARLVIA